MTSPKTPLKKLRAHRLPPTRQPVPDKEIVDQSNYGSESSDSDEEESLAPLTVSRVIHMDMDTPEYEEPDILLPSAVPNSAADINPVAVTTEQAALFPHNLFDFNWTQFPNPGISPSERREPFTPDGDVGPTTLCSDPYDVFTSIWDQGIMQHIVQETNKYAQQVASQKLTTNTMAPNSRITFWQDTTLDELYTYFAIVLAMGVVVKSKMEEYWAAESDIFVTPGFGAIMSIRRFQILNSCIHFNNNRDMNVQELSQSEGKLFKLEPIITHLNKKFRLLYTLSQNIALDESLLQWKGWLNINQFMSNKAAAVGIKTYELCESQTGYLWRFEIHAHKKTSSVPIDQQSVLDAPTPAIVLRLTNGLENKGHTLWMDNYYNSPALARHLKTKGFDVVGTLRTNRQFVPEQLMKLTKKDMQPGQITGYTSGDVDLMVWRDHNMVATISTYHGNATSDSDGKVKPVLIFDYNVMMGGVDKKDQMLAMYPIERKRTRVWYKKLFRRLLNVSVLNSFIIAKKSSSNLCHRSFRIHLIRCLLSRHGTARTTPRPLQNKSSVFEAKTHFLAQYPMGQNKSRLRRSCCQCKQLTRFYCDGCSKSVCLGSCFVSLHS